MEEIKIIHLQSDINKTGPFLYFRQTDRQFILFNRTKELYRNYSITEGFRIAEKILNKAKIKQTRLII